MPGPGSWLLLAELISGPHQPNLEWLQAWYARRFWRTAAMFHDAIPLGSGGAVAEFYATYLRGIAALVLVLATSEHVADQLRLFWNNEAIVPHGQLAMLPLSAEFLLSGGVDLGWSPSPLRSVEGLKLLQVGSLEPRKNHLALLKALAWLDSQHLGVLELDLVGWASNQAVTAMVQRAIDAGLPLRCIVSSMTQPLRPFMETLNSVSNGHRKKLSFQFWQVFDYRVCSSDGLI